MIHHGDCLDVMAGMDPESVDAIVTDPPYGLEFMGMAWDQFDGRENGTPRPRNEWGDFGSREHARGQSDLHRVTVKKARALQAFSQAWAEAAYRVAKPSAYLLAFGGTRTVHRMTVALEDAGWIIRDMLVWAYASGFPKSKASLKPAWEPIVMARKPGPLRDLAIDACRIGPPPPSVPQPSFNSPTGAIYGMRAGEGRNGEMSEAPGRWPANVILTDPIFDGGVEGVVGGGETASGKMLPTVPNAVRTVYGQDAAAGYTTMETYGDSGTYSRFFLIPKADRADREPIMGHWQASNFDRSGDAHRTEPADPPARVVSVWGGDEDDLTPGKKSTIARRNTHPTVKPTELMRHLVRLVTPTGGLVLDPFLGSGTTGIACELEGFPWIGIEREAEYVAIAAARLNGTQRGLGLEDVS